MRLLVGLIIGFIVLPLQGQNFEIYNGDTINRIDGGQLKQGLWIKFGSLNKYIIEQGEYVNSQKDGLWINYYPSGQKKNEITYVNGKAHGPACFYYPDGKVSEKGFWNVDHWEGQYHYYHESGQLAYDWNYDKNGKRTGTQKYYHENGNLKYEGEWAAGKTRGSLKMFNENGQLVSERVYNDAGQFASNVKHEPSKLKDEVESDYAEFSGTGMHTIYHLNGKPEKKGFFVRGKLFNGESYQYNNDGDLLHIKYYQNGELKRTEIVKNPG